MAACKPGDTILGMNLSHGGHLTHGHPLNFSGKYFKVVAYGVRKEDERIDYEELKRLAVESQAEGHRGRRLGLPAHDRLRGGAGGGRRLGRARHGRHRPHRRPRGRGPPPEPGPALRVRDHDHAQDAPRPPRRPHPVPGGMGEGDRQGRLPGRPGRAAHARDRGQGGGLQGSPRPGVEGLPAARSWRTPRPSPTPSRARAGGSSPAGPTTTSCWWTSSRRASPARWPRRRSTRPASPPTRTRSPSTPTRRWSPPASASGRPPSPRAG